jgi:hypothetical protein
LKKGHDSSKRWSPQTSSAAGKKVGLKKAQHKRSSNKQKGVVTLHPDNLEQIEREMALVQTYCNMIGVRAADPDWGDYSFPTLSYSLLLTGTVAAARGIEVTLGLSTSMVVVPAMRDGIFPREYRPLQCVVTRSSSMGLRRSAGRGCVRHISPLPMVENKTKNKNMTFHIGARSSGRVAANTNVSVHTPFWLHILPKMYAVRDDNVKKKNGTRLVCHRDLYRGKAASSFTLQSPHKG